MSREYIGTKEIAAKVRAELKAALPGWKFSVTYESFAGGSSIDLRLVSGPEEVIVSGSEGSLNHYDFLRDWGDRPKSNGVVLTDKGWEVMATATKALEKYHWDDSDARVDYFHCNFYMHVAIGKWDKPYTVKGK